ncbi:MAG: hypothetical protein WBQ95_07810 [Terracidiphilus sp.]
MEEWRRLTALYSEMGDVEIRELAVQINDLTPTAQQILRDELKKRGIPDKFLNSHSANREAVDNHSTKVHWDSGEDGYEDDDSGVAKVGSVEYTWKTGLCRCDSIDEAAQRGEMLRRAGIESWVQRPGGQFVVPWLESGIGDFQINVAADQFEQAKEVIAQPIPRDIIDELKREEEAPAYEIPVCPKCKAEDPTLESVEPTNNWLCESCGYTWSDPVPDSTTP